MRHRLRTLLIVLALGPMVLAGIWWNWPTIRDMIWQPKPARMMMDPAYP